MKANETQINFSYKNYCEIINKYLDFIIDFNDIDGKKNFVLIRHDVEFSVKRAYKLAMINAKLGVKNASFLFQVKSNAYNICSKENSLLVNKIKNLGFCVGLHFYVSHLKVNDWESLKKELLIQSKLFYIATGIKIDRFSYHRPPQWVLKNDANKIKGLINMYGKSYFEFSSNPKKIKYYADSNHAFKYGNPLRNTNFNKFQILLHPDEWSKKGLSESDNFFSLIKENEMNFKDVLEKENKNFKNYKYSFLK